MGNNLIDEVKSEQFAERMMTILNHGALNLMISIGYRTGLFDVMSELPASTSEEIAKAAGLNERYVREWLGAMVTGGIIDHYHEKKSYSLPEEHAVWLTRKAVPNNIAVTTQWISLLGSVEDKIVECFKNGGGVPYEAFKRFHEVMSDESYQTVIVPLLDQTLPLIEGIKERLEEGINVLDVGCGSGFALVHMAREFPNSRFTGYDISEEAIDRGTAHAAQYGLTNVTLIAKDVAEFDDVQKYDLITTFDAIHDQADPDRVLSNINRALKDDGVYLMQDIAGSSHVHNNMDHPLAPLLYTTSCMHCMTVSLSQNGKGLGAMWGKELATDMVKNAGFTQVEIKEQPHDPINYYYIIRK
ncbi:MAG: class I SAM-dependent methyltransferase [Candidatus Dadabacteria bacterium]|nr:methyltransferase domain-containing protein [Candidatus Dadabacteria bacterium]MCH7949098.1 methyltransferase domain-containing protein [Candidatus Dadabacteria bacterium]TDJ00969.1 MAG: class I SAM-dependent methyltransferase [Candidatus Dadabacteria bacterium]